MTLLPTCVFAIPATCTLKAAPVGNDVGPNSASFYYRAGCAVTSRPPSPSSIIGLPSEISSIERKDAESRSGEEIFLQGAYRYTPRAGFRLATDSPAVCDRDFSYLALGADYLIDSFNSLGPSASRGVHKFPAASITGEVYSTDFLDRF